MKVVSDLTMVATRCVLRTAAHQVGGVTLPKNRELATKDQIRDFVKAHHHPTFKAVFERIRAERLAALQSLSDERLTFVQKCQAERDAILSIVKELKVGDSVTVSEIVETTFDIEDQKTTFTVKRYGKIALQGKKHTEIKVEMGDGTQLFFTWVPYCSKFITRDQRATLLL